MSAPISLDEVKKHRNSESCWVVIHGNVYDLTKFLSEHPGGEQTILDVGGQDGTRSFDDVGHSDDARELMKKYKIGPLIVEETSFMEDSPDFDVCSSHNARRPRSSPSSGRSSKKKRKSKRKPSPRRPNPPHPPEPPNCARWKWALVALGGAVVIGVLVNQFLNTK